MLSTEQERWIAHLSDKDTIVIVPFDTTAEDKFQTVRKEIQNALGSDIVVEHHGATSLGISGQDEIDVYIPIPEEKFNILIGPLKSLFGEPRSLYQLERARFVLDLDGKHIDIFLINEEHDGWKKSLIFENYLRSHPESLSEYRQIKEDGNGSTVRKYYRRKIEFINRIILQVDVG